MLSDIFHTCPILRGLTGQTVSQLVSATFIIPICRQRKWWGHDEDMMREVYLFSASAGPEDERWERSSVIPVQQEAVKAPQYELVAKRLEEDGVLWLVDSAGVETHQTPCQHLTSADINSFTSSSQSTLVYWQTEPWLYTVNIRQLRRERVKTYRVFQTEFAGSLGVILHTVLDHPRGEHIRQKVTSESMFTFREEYWENFERIVFNWSKYMPCWKISTFYVK